MHDGIPYDPIRGQGHDCLKATQEESDRQSRAGQILVITLLVKEGGCEYNDRRHVSHS